MRGVKIFLILAFVVFTSIYASAASIPGNITTCQILDTPGHYALINDINDAQGTCLDISGNNITLEGNGYRILGNSSGYGLRAIGKNNISVYNLSFSHFSDGIYFESVSKSALINLISNYNQLSGLMIYNSSYINIDNIESFENGNEGIYVDSSTDSLMSNIRANKNGYDGIYVYSGRNNLILSSETHNNSFEGIYFDSSYGNQLLNITTSSNIDGVRIYNSSSHIISSAIANYNGNEGIYIELSTDVHLSNIQANKNGYDGIYLDSSLNNVISSSVLTGNQLSGMILDRSDNNKIDITSSNENGYTGIELAHSSNNILTSTVTNNNTFNDILSRNSFGILLWGDESYGNSSYNQIKSCTSKYNAYGMYLDYGSNHNNITDCIISNSIVADVFNHNSTTKNNVTKYVPVEYPPRPSGGGGGSRGGGGGGEIISNQPITIMLTNEELIQGVSKELREKDRLFFYINGFPYSLIVNKIELNNSVTMELINNFTLAQFEATNRSFGQDNTLNVRLNDVLGTRISLFVKLYSKNYIASNQTNSSNIGNQTDYLPDKPKKNLQDNIFLIIIYIFVILIMSIVVILIILFFVNQAKIRREQKMISSPMADEIRSQLR